MNGLYDLSKPFFTTGHMTYGDQLALMQMQVDLAKFYDAAVR